MKERIQAASGSSRVFSHEWITEERVQASEDESPVESLSRDEARAVARNQATRDLKESEDRISYVSFVPALQDFCYCEFRFEAPNGWVQSCRMLTAQERLPDEQISYERIRSGTLSGNAITSIGLYREKYGVGLAEAKAAVDRLIALGSENSRRSPA